MYLRRVALAALGSALLTFQSFGGVPASHAAEASEPILWGAYVPGAPWEADKLAAFETRFGKGVSIEHFGQAWSSNGQMQAFPKAPLQTVRDHGAIPLLDWGSWELNGHAVTQPNFTLKQIASGKYDAYIEQWAKDAKAWGHPMYLRLDWEMNGWWQFPWAVQTNSNSPADYVPMWRHVHDIFTKVGADNVVWVWCPNISSAKTTPFADVYPGDAYVDWVGLDGYNMAGDRGDPWLSFTQVFGGSAFNANHDSYAEALKVAPSKPIMIAETATSIKGGDPAAFVADTLTNALPNRFPAVKALVWFDWDGGNSADTFPIEKSSAEVAAFKAGIASPYYASNVFGSINADPMKSSTAPKPAAAAPSAPAQAPSAPAPAAPLAAAPAPLPVVVPAPAVQPVAAPIVALAPVVTEPIVLEAEIEDLVIESEPVIVEDELVIDNAVVVEETEAVAEEVVATNELAESVDAFVELVAQSDEAVQPEEIVTDEVVVAEAPAAVAEVLPVAGRGNGNDLTFEDYLIRAGRYASPA